MAPLDASQKLHIQILSELRMRVLDVNTPKHVCVWIQACCLKHVSAGASLQGLDLPCHFLDLDLDASQKLNIQTCQADKG
jgi:hypothetical protein